MLSDPAAYKSFAAGHTILAAGVVNLRRIIENIYQLYGLKGKGFCGKIAA